MKKLFVCLLSFGFLIPFTFAQTDEKVQEEVKIDMEQLQKDMIKLQKELKVTFENLKVDLEELEIDLSGLDELKDIDWKNHPDYNEGMTYLESEAFKKEMEKVKIEVNRAMEEVRLEMKELENINWKEINETVKEAMKEVEKELSKIREEEQ